MDFNGKGINIKCQKIQDIFSSKNDQDSNSTVTK